MVRPKGVIGRNVDAGSCTIEWLVHLKIKFPNAIVVSWLVLSNLRTKIQTCWLVFCTIQPTCWNPDVLIGVTSWNNPIRPIFKLPKGGRKLVECLPIIIKKIGKFGIAEFYISPATCQKFDINDWWFVETIGLNSVW